MKIILSLCFLLFFDNIILGQLNLVPNPSFEDLINCPDSSFSDVDLAVPWISMIATPDLFNPCSSVLYASAPLQNNTCYQPARTGVGYAGLLNYLTLPRTTEYMGVKLNKPLEKHKKYYIAFYVSLRNCGDFEICYSDGMGLAFSSMQYQEEVIVGAEQIPPFTPAIQNPVGNILKDTANWIEISGCYTANGTEQYAIIGNFRSSANTKSEGCVGVTGSYHYVDDVGVYEYPSLPDTIVLCSGEYQTIGKSFLNATYLWNTGSTDSTITIYKEGQYILNTIIGNCVLSDTIVVLEMDKLLTSLPVDTLVCRGETLLIDIPIIGNYVWSNGTNSNQISISTEGFYTVSIENTCGLFNHSFEVSSEICDCMVYIPNAFSPNDDGNNDFLNCSVGCDFPFQSNRFQVFDRWGSLVYSNNSTDHQTIKWDGTFRGKVLDSGVYTWVFEYEYTRNGAINKKTINGNVSIIK